MKGIILHYLAVVLIFFCPYSVMAQLMEPIWYATLTVDVGTAGGKTKRGCGGGIDACSATTLSDRTFTIEGQTYTITELVFSGNEFVFILSGTNETSDAELIKHELLVGSPVVPFTMDPSEDSSPEGRIEKRPINNPTEIRFYWAASDLSWSDGQKVLVSLVPPHTHGPRPGIPELTAVTTGPNAPTTTSLTFTMGCVSPGATRVTDYVLRAENKADPTKVYWHYEPPPSELSSCALTPAITATMTGLPSNTSATTYKVKARARNLFARTSRWSNEVELATTAASLQVNQEETGTDFAKADPPTVELPSAEDPVPEPVLVQPPDEDPPAQTQESSLDEPEQGGGQPDAPPEQEGPPATQDVPAAEEDEVEDEIPAADPPSAELDDASDAAQDRIDEQLALLSVTIGDITSTDEYGGMTFTVRLDPAPAIPVAVKYATASRSAKAGQDYKPRVGTLHFETGQDAANIIVEIISDEEPEPDEFFRMRVKHPSTREFLAQATGTITDDDEQVEEAAEAEPTFAFTGSVAAQAYTAGTAITPLQLPEAVGGQGEVTYRVLGLPAGLSFDASTRTISGTPQGGHRRAVEVACMAQDSTGTIALTFFAITVNPPLDFSDLFN